MTIQPSSQDSYIDSKPPNQDVNWGTIPDIPVRGHDTPSRCLFQFDLSSIPSGSTVNSATLKLYYTSYGWEDPVGRTYWAYRITQSWIEGVWPPSDPPGVTWNSYDGNNPWATPGGDYTTTGGASATVPSSWGWMTWTVTDIVKTWVEGGQPNYGFLIKDGSESGTIGYTCFFCSREHQTPSHHPILEVTYTPGAPVDSDGLSDAEEEAGWDLIIRDCTGSQIGSIHVTSDPLVADADGDTLNDYWEREGWDVQFEREPGVLVFYDVKSHPQYADYDGDGKDDSEEKTAVPIPTDPNRDDTDCDSAYDTDDGFEIDHGLNPCDWDTDDDGISDGKEIDLWLDTGCSLTEAVARTKNPQAVPPTPVGGEATPINMPINNPELQIPCIWPTTIILLMVATAVYVKLVKRRKKKQ